MLYYNKYASFDLELYMKNNFWKKVFFGGSAIFSASAVFIAIIMLIINSNGTENMFNIALSVYRLLMIAVFCYVFAFATAFYTTDSMKEWVRLPLHFILTTVGFFVCIYAPVSSEISAAGGELPTENAIIVLALFAVFYFICYGIFRLIKRAVKKKKSEKEEYSPVFKKQNKK